MMHNLWRKVDRIYSLARRKQWHRAERSFLFGFSSFGGVYFIFAMMLESNERKHDCKKAYDRLFHSKSLLLSTISSCEISLEDDDQQVPTGYTESDRFRDCLEYHRSLLPDYTRRWVPTDVKKPGRTTWPKNVPSKDEVKDLETDFSFCQRSPRYRNNDRTCQNLQFRIASYYLQEENPEHQQLGYKLVKQLAESGHPDGMCLYGIILNEGIVDGVDVNPKQAVNWWRRCVDLHRHVNATYELAVALYTGEGVPENPELAVHYFRRIAHLGHSGAAYMLGECLLDGVGTERDRANALEWLVTAAELGHQLARERVIAVLQQDYEDLNKGKTDDGTVAWVGEENADRLRAVNIERKYTVGGGVKNPKVLEHRRTKVQESRGKRIVND